jgi:hypothetical protein
MSKKQHSKSKAELFKKMWEESTSSITSDFPPQKLTEKQKKKIYGSVENWALKIFDYLGDNDGFDYNLDLYNNSSSYYDMLLNYKLANGVMDKSDYDFAFKHEDAFKGGSEGFYFPAEITHYDISSKLINLLVGETLKRPFKHKVVSTNPESISSAVEEKKRILREHITDIFNEEVAKIEAEQQGAEFQPPEKLQPEIEGPEDIDKYMTYSYKDIRTQKGGEALAYLRVQQELRHKSKDGMEHQLISGLDLYYVTDNGGEPALRVIDPRYVRFERTPGMMFLHDAGWVIETRYMSRSEIYDEFHEFLEEEDVDLIDSGLLGNDIWSDNLGWNNQEVSQHHTYNDTDNLLRVRMLEWKSLRKLGFLKYRDEFGKLQETVVDETYKKREEDEEIEWKWIPEVWEAVCIDKDYVLFARPKANQFRSMNNPAKCKLGYTGVVTDYSLMDKMRPIQLMYNIIMYRVHLAIAKDIGEGTIIDMAQLPNHLRGFDLSQTLYYLKTMGILFIDSMSKDPDTGLPSGFNQFQKISFSQFQTIQGYMSVLMKLEQLAEDITGITRQRQGAVSHQETVGGVERSVMQSSHMTEVYFFLHSQALKHAMTNLINISTISWAEGKRATYVTDDMGIKLFDLSGVEYALCEYDVFLEDDAKFVKIEQMLEGYAQAGLQNDAVSLADVVKVMNANSIVEKEKILEVAEEARKQMQQEQQQMAQQQHEQSLQMQQQLAQQEQQMAQLELQLKDSLNMRDNQVKLEIAKINAESKIKDDHRNTPEVIERELSLKEQELNDKREAELLKINQQNNKDLE